MKRALLVLATLAATAVAIVLISGREDSSSGQGSTRVPLASAPASPLQAQNGPPQATPSPLQDPATAISLDGKDAFGLRFKKQPRAGVVFDMKSGRVLWRRNPVQTMPVASLTKMMSALVVTEHGRPREQVRITKAALRYSGSGVGLLPKGRHVPLEALLHGMLLPSGNDASIALAVHTAGSERRFVRMMNRKARRLGLFCTRFASSHGLEPGNRSCAADLAVLTRIVMKVPRIARIVRKRQARVRFPIKGRRLYLNNTNPLLRARYPGTVGLKTGSTDEAGHCIVAVVKRGGRNLGVVLLDSPDTARQAKKLLGSAFRAD
ncbi:MAG: D-alanyl-D-alanine carboxypeptidase [Thermoleophilaceae bacterium]|nr:D-alanyl-D-alanine carboxypeptidase [Thermoleophilaceae bacterium]